MNGENILHLNLPNVFTVGLILAVWVVIWLVVGQGVRRALGVQLAGGAQSDALSAAGMPGAA